MFTRRKNIHFFFFY